MAKFELGQVVVTQAVDNKMNIEDGSASLFAHFVLMSLTRYSAGDWGDISKSDAAANDRALKDGNRIMGVYIYDGEETLNYLKSLVFENGQEYVFKKTEDKDSNNITIWIITEWDRSVTTVLFPDEY